MPSLMVGPILANFIYSNCIYSKYFINHLSNYISYQIPVGGSRNDMDRDVSNNNTSGDDDLGRERTVQLLPEQHEVSQHSLNIATT